VELDRATLADWVGQMEYRRLGPRLYSIPADDIKNIHCDLTLLLGNLIYTAQE
jgi:hypothetical protein